MWFLELLKISRESKLQDEEKGVCVCGESLFFLVQGNISFFLSMIKKNLETQRKWCHFLLVLFCTLFYKRRKKAKNLSEGCERNLCAALGHQNDMHIAVSSRVWTPVSDTVVAQWILVEWANMFLIWQYLVLYCFQTYPMVLPRALRSIDLMREEVLWSLTFRQHEGWSLGLLIQIPFSFSWQKDKFKIPFFLVNMDVYILGVS